MGYIKKEFIEKLEDIVLLQEVIGDFVELKRAGANLKGLSPFNEERTPSFVVSPVKNIWKDNSSGKGGVGPFSFLMEHKGMSYPEAVKYVADKYHETIEYADAEYAEKIAIKIEKKEKLRKVLKLVFEQYFEKYRSLEPKHPAKTEVEVKRQYTQETIVEWGIGFAPENFLYDKMNKSGYLQEGQDLGLIKKGYHDNLYDHYTNRVIYRIDDSNGLIIGLAGRDVSEKGAKSKWINPDVNEANILYNKSKVWYGMHKARMNIRKKREAWIVEGYNDVIAWHLYGLDNTVAPCGTAITPTQINEIKKLCQKVVFAMDPDRAGRDAVLKHIPNFIAQGFRVEVVSLDVDPDDFSRKYSELIVLSGGLDKMFSAPGIRRDGFKLLIDEYIKIDYLDLEEKLENAKIELQLYADQHKERKAHLIKEQNIIKVDYSEADSKLKDYELSVGKTSKEYKEQYLTVSALKKKLSNKKLEVECLPIEEHHKIASKRVEELTEAFNHAFQYSDVKRNDGARKICAVIASIDDISLAETYINWVQKESGVLKTSLNKWIKEFRLEKVIEEIEVEVDLEYELPKDVKIPFSELENDIKNYGMFMANCKIWVALPKAILGKIYFTDISNFDIEILQHMADDSRPSLLIRMKNLNNNETIFDCPTETFNTVMRFKDILSRYHNYIFRGKQEHIETLHSFLFNKMGKGVKLDVLGWQIDGRFHAWNNKIISPDEEEKEFEINDNGQYVKGNNHYYIASANKLFKNNIYKYKNEKSFREIKNKISFYELLSQAAKVHRHHYISPILYGITTLFRDFVVEKENHFPILFLYGQGGTGKDELARLVMSLTGVPQKPINLESELSTQKATVRVLAQFRNGIIMFSEYKRGNQKIDGSLKNVYDNNGYSIGTIESKFSTDYIPVETGLILTGNEFPESEPLIQRTIWNQMDKNIFTQEEKEAMEVLKKMVSAGVSGYASEFIKHRNLVEEKYSEEHSKWTAILTPIFPDVKVRMIDNLAIIAAFYGIFKDIFQFSFSQYEMIDHFKIGIEQQMFRINSTSLMVKFWDCFISSFRGTIDDRIQAKKIVNIEENSLYVQWTHVYMKIQKQWFLLYRESAPKKEVVLEELKKADLFVSNHSSYSFDTGRKAVRSSAIELNLSQLDKKIKNDIIGAFMEQVYSETLFGESEAHHLESLYDDTSDSTEENVATELKNFNENSS